MIFTKTLQRMLGENLTSRIELNRLLPTEKNKKVIHVMNDELGKKMMREFVVLRTKKYS